MENNGGMMNINPVQRRVAILLTAPDFLPRSTILGGYVLIGSDATLGKFIKSGIFGMPAWYIDSLRAIRPGTPLFLYNYESRFLHGIFEATSFGGVNIDPTIWPDANGRTQFPAQIRIRRRTVCRPLGERFYRRHIHHIIGHRVRVELTVPEAIDLLDTFRTYMHSQ